MLLIDTDVLSEPVRKLPQRKVCARLGNHAGNLAASVITLNELRYGAMLNQPTGSLWSRIETTLLPLVHWIPVDEAIAFEAADLRANLRRKGEIVGSNDCIIAATALVNDWILVTRNIAHFKRMPGLQLDNWFK